MCRRSLQSKRVNDMNRAVIARAAVVLVLATTAGAAAAQNLSRQQMTALRSACAADVRTVCAGVQPGGGRILQCFQANPDKVSQTCKDALAGAMAAKAQ